MSKHLIFNPQPPSDTVQQQSNNILQDLFRPVLSEFEEEGEGGGRVKRREEEGEGVGGEGGRGKGSIRQNSASKDTF